MYKLYGKDGLYHKIGNVVLSKLSEYDKTIRGQNGMKGARLSDIDLESLAIEESIIPSDLPPLDDIYFPGDEPVAKQDIDDYENLYFDSLSQSLPEEDYPNEPFAFSFEQTLTMPTKKLPETQSPEIKKAVSRLKDYFSEHETSLEERTQLLIEEMNQKPKNIEKRGVRITMGDTPGQYKSNPVSLMHSETLKKDIVLSEKVEDSGHVPKELLHYQAKDIPRELKKIENAPKHNLDFFSEKNRKAILEQMPDATFVYGTGQWRLKGRKVMESEKQYPIIVIRPVIDKETNIVKRYAAYDAYDISQTEPLTKAEWTQVKREMNTQSVARPQKRIKDPYTPSIESEVKKDIYHLKKMLRDDTQSYLNQRLYRQLQFEIENGI